VSKKFGEWHQKTNKTEDTNKLTLLAFKILAILHNKRLATFITLLETLSKGLFRNRSQNSCHTLLDCRLAAGNATLTEAQIPLQPTCTPILNY
jgi:outer membrane PBP1 activator LpoA protein